MQKPEQGKIQAGVLVQCLPEDWVSVGSSCCFGSLAVGAVKWDSLCVLKYQGPSLVCT